MVFNFPSVKYNLRTKIKFQLSLLTFTHAFGIGMDLLISLFYSIAINLEKSIVTVNPQCLMDIEVNELKSFTCSGFNNNVLLDT